MDIFQQYFDKAKKQLTMENTRMLISLIGCLGKSYKEALY